MRCMMGGGWTDGYGIPVISAETGIVCGMNSRMQGRGMAEVPYRLCGQARFAMLKCRFHPMKAALSLSEC